MLKWSINIQCKASSFFHIFLIDTRNQKWNTSHRHFIIWEYHIGHDRLSQENGRCCWDLCIIKSHLSYKYWDLEAKGDHGCWFLTKSVPYTFWGKGEKVFLSASLYEQNNERWIRRYARLVMWCMILDRCSPPIHTGLLIPNYALGIFNYSWWFLFENVSFLSLPTRIIAIIMYTFYFIYVCLRIEVLFWLQ